ncbi:O-methyltransferase [Bosea sp. TWI1241]|uniref:O-methyltransferase n=1 Tax=Bosea sp. TWI1241 TaxID=3148904 RepID=UPI00320A30A9
MAGTFKKIDYRLRPAKHAERIMLIDLFKRMRFAPIETYQYVGFGSVAFIDFRMVHKSLGIKDLISIEATDDPEERTRFERNNPYAGLTLHFGHSSAVLPTLNFRKRSLVWLDYDGTLSRSVANDLATVGRHAHSGSFVGVTFTAAFPTSAKERDKELGRLKDEFPDFLAEDTKASSFDGPKCAEFGRSTLGAILEKAVLDADAGEPNLALKRNVRQVCFFRYKDGTLPMVTVGWIIINNADMDAFEASHFPALPFFETKARHFVLQFHWLHLSRFEKWSLGSRI